MAKVQLWKRRPSPDEPISAPPDDGGTSRGDGSNVGSDDDSDDDSDDAGVTTTQSTDVSPPADSPVPAKSDHTTSAPAESEQATSGQAEPGQAESERTRSGLRLSVANSTPVTLSLAAHPKQAIVTALAMGATALLIDRPLREAAVVAGTVLVGQTILGWHNDLVDRERDEDHRAPGKPLADGRLDSGTVWFALTIAVLLVIPLSISTGVMAGTLYLLSLIIAILGNVVLRQGWLSWAPWAASFALYPAYLSYGGWGGSAEGDPPTIAMTVLAALLGIGVHVLRAIWGLVADDEDGWTYLPLALGRRLGATRLLILAAAYTAVILALMAIIGATTGLRQ